MKIFIIPVDKQFQPDHQNYVWPPQNQRPNCDFGVEQNFLDWLISNPDLLCDQPADADWCYVPIFWNRRYINVPDADGHWGGGEAELATEVARCRLFGERVFTITEASERVLHPNVDWGDMVMFCASRRVDSDKSIDIPLLAAPYLLDHKPAKKYLACFQGNLSTDGVRMQMRELLEGRTDCLIEDACHPMQTYIDGLLSSYIALAPRGMGAASFRFFEAMSLGVAPLYISDLDCRPFKKFIDWDSCSMWLPNNQQLLYVLDSIVKQRDWIDNLLAMGRQAKYTYDEHLCYGRWCKYVIRELELL
jgi:hypothetical protein